MAYLKVRLDPNDWEASEVPEAVDVALSDGDLIRYFPRRTCQIVVSINRSPASYGGRVHRCSSCGKALPGSLFRNGWTQLDYCPRCGARVTEVVRDGD